MFVTPYHVFEVLSCKHKMNEREILVCVGVFLLAGMKERRKKECCSVVLEINWASLDL